MGALLTVASFPLSSAKCESKSGNVFLYLCFFKLKSHFKNESYILKLLTLSNLGLGTNRLLSGPQLLRSPGSVFPSHDG